MELGLLILLQMLKNFLNQFNNNKINMKRNIIRKNTSLNGISIERQIEIPDYDMTLQKLSTMTPYLEGRRYVYGGVM